MSQFYARYVPPSIQKSDPPAAQEPPAKRKRIDQKVETSPKTPQPKKQKPRETERVANSRGNDVPKDLVKPLSGNQVLDKYSISGFAQKNGEKEVTVRKVRRDADQRAIAAQRGSTRPNSYGRETRIQSELSQEEVLDRTVARHASVLSKFGHARDRTRNSDFLELDTQGVDETHELHDLGPIPQPQTVDQPAAKPTFSTLPAWQSKALRIEKSHSVSLSELGVNEQILKNLSKRDIREAFPVQATVIPLLLEQRRGRASDICVSAATGSGKTLSYVLPIIQALREKKTRTLRAVIVVPTRELVKQVRETCEVCASGSDLRIVTAVGSKSLKDEQDNLIAAEEVYDPVEYRKQQQSPIDWGTFDLADEFRKARERKGGYRVNFVTKTRIKADVLITTPGRLVDHLKNTRGFNLDHVQWLVVDEADRLLNESYQEWIESVVPALQSRNATKDLDQALQGMRMGLPPRVVRKVLLSATMTQDISKLNALELHDPKLIILGSADRARGAGQSSVGDARDSFHIPSSLQETAVTFKEGGEKPLVLLKLLTKHIRQSLRIDKSGHAARSSTEESSSDESTSESEASSTSDTDSDTDGSSSTSLSSSSSDESTSSSDSESDSDTDTNQRSIRQPRPKSKQRHAQSHQQSQPRVLIFTRSTSSASRLSRLLTLLSPSLASSLALLTRSTSSSSSSRKALSSFRSSKITILIATDRASRGIDVPGLEHVINYDIPGSALTYVHRVGRTARAGLMGHAWTLVEHREGRWFWNEIGGKGPADENKIRRSEGTMIKRMPLDVDSGDDNDEQLRARYEDALKTLGEEVKGE